MESQISEKELIVTGKAVNQIKTVMRESKIPAHFGLRVGVKGGGCSGLSYTLGFDENQKEGDTVIEEDGVRLFIDGKSLFYISGMTLDFSDGLNGKGFTFDNPNATKTCGCGSSFGV